ncbi:MAG: hypothetical protein H7235_09200 [Bdellovibrionaceae bacterium]|nr:hypothetical protein [Pseudobdellovibrionaceae bacterium]
MKKNKYLIFASIGFELVALIVFFIYLGEYLVDKQGWPQSTKAFGIVLAFALWITSLVVKLKSLEKSKRND